MAAGFYAWSDVVINSFRPLGDFQFSFLSPAFWIILVVLYFLVLRIWVAKKAFSFTLFTGAVLLLTTKLEHLLGSATILDASMDVAVIRILSLTLIAIVLFLYAFLMK